MRPTRDVKSPRPCIGMQPFWSSTELLTTSCSRKSFTMIPQTVQELLTELTNPLSQSVGQSVMHSPTHQLTDTAENSTTFATLSLRGTSAGGNKLRPHSIILASCKPGCKPGVRPGLQPGFRQVRVGLLSTRFRPAFDFFSKTCRFAGSCTC